MGHAPTGYEKERESVVEAYTASFREALAQQRKQRLDTASDLFDLDEQLRWADNNWDYADSITTACSHLAGDDDEAYETYRNRFEKDYESIFTEAAHRFHKEQGR